MHLVREMHDVVLQPVSIWCDASDWNDSHATQDIDRATCVECLKSAVSYGIEAAQRLAAIPRFMVKR